jgi:hypothetical protein
MNAKFVAAHQQAGDFDKEGNKKNGGNVASYFCTPDGRVINAVLGPVGADDLVREAQWAINVYAAGKSSDVELRQALADAHRTAQGRGQQARQIHQLLASRPLPGLDQVYRGVFALLGEGERAKGLESPAVLALRELNTDLAKKKQQLKEALGGGTKSAAAQALQKANERLSDDVDELEKKLEEARKRVEREAFERLRVANSHLESGRKDKAKDILEGLLRNYAETQAAKPAARLLDSLTRSATSTAAAQE